MKKRLEARPPAGKTSQEVRQSTASLHGFGYVGFLILSALSVLLFLFILFEAWVLHSLGGFLVAFILLGLIIALVNEALHLKIIASTAGTRELLLIALAHIAGAWLTFEISHTFGLGAVLASALIGLLGAIFFPEYDAPVFCGSFVGMCSADVYIHGYDVLLAGAFAGLVYILGREVLNGFGGKLGTIAFAGTLLTGLGLKRQFIISPVPPFDLAWHIVLYATIAAVLTYWLSVSLKWGPVLASAVVGLAGGLLLPLLHPISGGMLAVVVFCASFTGMSSPERLPGIGLMTLAGLFTGIIFLYSMPIFGGAGGKLGTIAFGSSLAVWGYRQTFLRRPEKIT
jgi:hypothetical protein